MVTMNTPALLPVDLLTAAEVALVLKVPVSWIYDRTRLRGPGRIPHIKLGKYLRFDANEVRTWLSRFQQS